MPFEWENQVVPEVAEGCQKVDLLPMFIISVDCSEVSAECKLKGIEANSFFFS